MLRVRAFSSKKWQVARLIKYWPFNWECGLFFTFNRNAITPSVSYFVDKRHRVLATIKKSAKCQTIQTEPALRKLPRNRTHCTQPAPDKQHPHPAILIQKEAITRPEPVALVSLPIHTSIGHREICIKFAAVLRTGEEAL